MCHRHHLLALTTACAVTVSTAGVAHAQGPGVVKPPVVVTHVDAVYPPSAVATREHADVLLHVTVDIDGHVTKVEVAQSSGHADLDEAAIVAARQWTFTPATRDGQPFESRIPLSFHFAPPAPPPEEVQTEPTGVVPTQQATQPAQPPSGHGAQPAREAKPPAKGAPTGAEEEEEEPTQTVEVIARARPPSAGASDFNLHVGRLQDIPKKNASEMLKLAPGILLTNEGGEGHAEQVFLRGFDAREGQDIEFTVGGVPINESGNLHGNGYADTHFIIPELVESLRVVEGPFDPRQGNYAVAGSADYELGLDRRGLTARYTTGSFGTQRGLLMWGPGGESTHTFAAAEAYKTDGYGQNRDAQRGSAMAQYEGRLPHGSWRINGQVYTTTFHTAGVIREDDYENGTKGFYDTYDFGQGGDSQRASIAGDIETKTGATTLSQQLFLIKRTMRLREDFTGYLLDVQEPLQEPHTQRGDLIDLNVDELTIGGRGYARWQTKALRQKQLLEIGYFARYDQAGGSQQRLSPTTLVPYATETNLQSNLVDVGLYGDADVKPGVKWLTFKGGVRADVFSFDVNDLCAVHSVDNPSKTNPPLDQSCLDQQDFGAHREPNQRSSTGSTAVLPKGTILVGPFAHFVLSLSYGQGVRSIDPSYITQDVKTPFASINAYEGGLAYAGGVGKVSLVARSIFFATHVDRDLIFSETEGRNILGVGTTRAGWVGAVRATGPWFDESANLTLVRSTYDDTHLLVAYVPDVVARSDTALWTELPWKIQETPLRGALSTGVTYVGRRALPYGARSDTIFTVDLNATLAWRGYEAGLIVTNLLDEKYRLGEYNYVSIFQQGVPPTLVPGRLFTAGAPRGIFGTFSVNFGGT